MTKLTVALSFLVMVPACMDGGVRNQTGTCPDGEVCNPSTPNGLLFEGPRYSDCGLSCDPGVKTTAIGGTQTLSIADGYTGLPFTTDFDATGYGTGLSISSISPPTVQVRGETESWTELRIIDSRGALYDKIDLRARPVETVKVTPDTGWLTNVADRPWALYAGGSVGLVISLYGSGRRLVDQSLTAQVVDQPNAVRQTRWDRITVSELAVGDHTLTVEQGESAHDTTVRVVDTADDISALANLGNDPSAAFPAGEAQVFCFEATNADALIIGIQLEFAGTGPIEVEPYASVANCVTVTGTAAGPAVLDVSGGGAAYTFPLEVTDPPAP